MSIEPKLPLMYGKKDSFYDSHNELKAVVKQNLKNLFYTSQGEKKRDINFGIGIKEFLFEIFTQEKKQMLIQRINEQTSKYMPFITILKIDVNFIELYNELYVNFQYFIKSLNESDILKIQVKAEK